MHSRKDKYIVTLHSVEYSKTMKKEQTTAILLKNMDKSPRYHAKQEKSGTQDWLSWHSIQFI